MIDETTIRQQVLATIKERTGLDVRYEADNIIINQCIGQMRIAGVFPVKFTKHVVDGIPLGLPVTNPPTILIAPEIHTMVRADLRRQKIGYLDGLGNAYLDAPPIFMMVELQPTAKAEKLHAEKAPAAPRTDTTRAFNEKGLRLLFALLNEPGLEKLPYRELAKKTGLALGTVHNVMAALKELKYLRTRGKTKVLLDKRDLLEKCVNNFPNQLRPRLHLGTYRPLQATPDWWKTADLTGLDACWGGEPGAELLTHYLQAERLTLYVFGDTRPDLKRLPLIHDPRGTVEIMRAFWPKPEKEPDMLCAPPLVVYADLLATRDGRNREAAQRIYNDHLLQIIE